MNRSFSRPRKNQPSGFVLRDPSRQIRRIHTVRHDYIFYPNDWVTDSGESFQQGYYDENGVRYNNVAVQDTSMIFTCEYCGTQINAVWKEGEALSCPNCGAPLKPDIIDNPDSTPEYDPQEMQDLPNSREGVSRGKASRPRILLLAVALIAITSAVLNGVKGRIQSQQQNVQEVTYYADNSLYVDAIGRTCYLDGDNYYDKQTDCWFWYNEEFDTWQYWYEGVSSEYGDYGWMEFDDEEGIWYIQAENGEWIQLPQDQIKSYFWHM